MTRKIGRKCRHQLGKTSLVVVLLTWAIAGTKPMFAGDILPPGDPRPMRPPVTNRDYDDESRSTDLERKRKQREEREKAFETPPKTPATKRAEALSVESQKERPLRLFFETSYVKPGIRTKGHRRSYTLDSTSHFQLFLRGFPAEPSNQVQFWWGFRLAPFAGSGIYEEIPGRFGFLYFGPIVGLGKIDTLRDTLGEASRDQGGTKNETATRHGWLLTAGIAGQSRVGRASRDQDKAKEDLTSKPFGMDAPGLWCEARYLSVHYGAIGLNLFTGAQAGKEKNFYWAGIGLAGWY